MNMLPYVKAVGLLALGYKIEDGLWSPLGLVVANDDLRDIDLRFWRPDLNYPEWKELQAGIELLGIGTFKLYYPSKGVGVEFTHTATQKKYSVDDEFTEPWNISQRCGIYAVCMALGAERGISAQKLAEQHA